MSIRYTPVTEQSHPNLWATIQKCSGKSGVYFNDVLHIHQDWQTGMFLETTLATDPVRKNLLLGEKGLKIAGYTDDSRVPLELEAAIYHEMAHIKHNDVSKLMIGKISPLAGLTVGLIAMRMIEYHQEKKQNRTEQNRTEQNRKIACRTYHLRIRKDGWKLIVRCTPKLLVKKCCESQNMLRQAHLG